MQGLELMFHVEQKGGIHAGSTAPKSFETIETEDPDSTQIIADTLRKQEEAMPVDLRADTLLDQDKILNWSSPDQSPNEPELPLTGEQLL